MSSFWAPIDELHEILALGVLLLVCGVALIAGGKVERTAGAVALVDAFGLSVLAMVLDRADRVWVTEGKSLVILLVYVAMTLRWPNRWLVVMTGLQAFAVLLHLSTLVDRTILASVNGLLLNVTGWLMLLLLGAVTMMRIFTERGRRRAVDP